MMIYSYYFLKIKMLKQAQNMKNKLSSVNVLINVYQIEQIFMKFMKNIQHPLSSGKYKIISENMVKLPYFTIFILAEISTIIINLEINKEVYFKASNMASIRSSYTTRITSQRIKINITNASTYLHLCSTIYFRQDLDSA